MPVVQKAVGLFFGSLNAASTLSVIIVVIYGATLTIKGSMSAGDLTSFILYSLTGDSLSQCNLKCFYLPNGKEVLVKFYPMENTSETNFHSTWNGLLYWNCSWIFCIWTIWIIYSGHESCRS